jgi:hypothetical protein
MSVRFAKVKAKGGNSTMGTVEVKADVDTDLRSPDDTLAVYFDGINLFAAPFSHFVLASMDDENDGEYEEKLVYKYAADRLRVKLDMTEGFLRVDNNSVNLFGLGNANGVDVEFHVGNGVAVENIVLDERDQYHRPQL